MTLTVLQDDYDRVTVDSGGRFAQLTVNGLKYLTRAFEDCHQVWASC